MKATLYDSNGIKKGEIELPKIFETPIREDIISKVYEALKFREMQPYSSYPEAGKRHSASGIIRHGRHRWKSQYGRGISRVPRKIMWRRGTQFYWIGAEVSSTRGGRRAHPPKGLISPRKINKKELKLALAGAIASTINKEFISKRYSSIGKVPSPVVIESLPTKAKSLKKLLISIFDSLPIFKEKKVRAGKGKLRGRKYKSNSGLLIVTGKEEKLKSKEVEIKPIDSLKLSDLYPLGRLTLFTKKSLEEISNVA